MTSKKLLIHLIILFLISALEKFGVGIFIGWIKIFLYEQESCVINGGITIKYFKLEKRARQGDPVSAYLFILYLEIPFMLIKNNKSIIKGIKMFENTFLCTAYADDSTFFLKDKKLNQGTTEYNQILLIFYGFKTKSI